MKYYVVLDTNVLVSAMLKSDSVPGRLLWEALAGEIIPILSDEIFAEYLEVLARPKFRFDQKAVQILLEGLRHRSLYLQADSVTEMLIDPKDTAFYDVVMEARKEKDAWLVTGNIRHFPVRYFIISPREMLDILKKD